MAKRKKKLDRWQRRPGRSGGKKQAKPVATTPRKRPWIPYAEYLQSNHWKARRRQACQGAGWKCQRCGDRGLLNVHHKTYDRLWCEKKADLEVLCVGCHEQAHAGIIEMENHLSAIAREPL